LHTHVNLSAVRCKVIS